MATIERRVINGKEVDVTVLAKGESFRGGQVVNESEWRRQQQFEQEARLLQRERDKLRAPITKSTIVIDDTGKQTASIIERGKGEVDIIEYNKPQRQPGITRFGQEDSPFDSGEVETRITPKATIRTIRGEPISVTELRQRKEKEIVRQPQPLISSATPLTAEDKAEKRIQDINRQLMSRIVRPEAKEYLQNEKQLLERSLGIGLVNLPPQKSQPEIKEWQVNYPTQKEKDAWYNRFTNWSAGSPNREAWQKTMDFINQPAPEGTVYGEVPLVGLGRSGVKTLLKAPKIIRGAIGTAKTLGAFTLQNVAITEAGIRTTSQTAPEEQKKLEKELKNKGVNLRKTFGKILSAEDEAIFGNQEKLKGDISPTINLGFVTLSTRGIIRDLPTGTLLTQDKAAFEKAAREEAKKLNLDKQQTETFIDIMERQKAGRAYTELATLLSISRQAESIGRTSLRKKFIKQTGEIIPKEKISSKLFWKVGSATAIGGAYEGAVGEMFQRYSRSQDQNLKATLGAGAVGTVFAGVAGGTLASRSAKGKGQILEKVLYVVDPLEYPGDVAQNIVEKAQQKIWKKSFLQPTLDILPGGNIRLATSVSGKMPTPFTKFSKQQENLEKNYNRMINKPSVPTRDKTYSFNELISDYGKIPTITKPDKKKPDTPIKTFQDTVTKQDEFYKNYINNYENKVNTYTSTSTQTPAMTQMFVPTITPFPRLPVPIPLTLPGGAGGVGSRVGKKSKFYNETQLALGFLFGSQNQVRQQFKNIKSPAKKTKRKKNVKKKK